MEHNIAKAVALAKKMDRCSVTPDVFTYNVLLTAFCGEGRLDEAELFYKNMIEKGIEPNRSTFTTMINGYVAGNNMR